MRSSPGLRFSATSATTDPGMREAAARQIEPEPAMLSCRRFMNNSRTRRSIRLSSARSPDRVR